VKAPTSEILTDAGLELIELNKYGKKEYHWLVKQA
jgi:hypothetical protein